MTAPKWIGLQDVVAAYRAAPRTYSIPRADQRSRLRVGDVVKLDFEADRPALDGSTAERMSVEAAMCGRIAISASWITSPGNFIDQLIKLDLRAGTARRWFKEDAYPGEPVFMAAPDVTCEDEAASSLGSSMEGGERRSYWSWTRSRSRNWAGRWCRITSRSASTASTLWAAACRRNRTSIDRTGPSS